MEIRARFGTCVLISVLYYIFAFVNSKLYSMYQNINVFFLCINSYFNYNDTGYLDIIIS